MKHTCRQSNKLQITCEIVNKYIFLFEYYKQRFMYENLHQFSPGILYARSAKILPEQAPT